MMLRRRSREIEAIIATILSAGSTTGELRHSAYRVDEYWR